MTDDLFNDVFHFMLATKKTQECFVYHEAVPSKLPYKWINKYGQMTVRSSKLLIFKQDEGNALDSAQMVVHYNKIFDVLKDIHEV